MALIHDEHRRILVSRLSFCFVFAAAGLLVATTPAAAAQVRDSLAAQDTVLYLLEPISVSVERERSAPPPVVAIEVDPNVVRRSQEPDPYRMLRQAAGVEVHDQGQGPGYASNVTMRGFTSDHSADVLLVIDGVPVNLPAHGHIEGYADWNVLMPRSVSSLRVVHGGASPLYGDFALAGVVEVFTRAEADRTELVFGGTSYGDLRTHASTGHRGPRSGSFFAGSFDRMRGWRRNSDYWLTNGLARGWREVSDGRLEGGVSIYASDWSSPGFVSVPRFNDSDLESAVDDTDGGNSRRVVAHGRYAVGVGERTYLQAALWGLASRYALFLNIPGHDHGAGAGVTVQSGEWDERIGTGTQLELGSAGSRGDWIVGASGRSDWVDYRHAATFQRTPVFTEIDLRAGHASGALYGRWRQTFARRIGLDVGARLDVLRHRSRPASGLAPETSAVNTVFSPKLGVRYGIDPRWSLRASSARGFRSAVGIIGDPGRAPYIAWSHELGAEFQSARANGALTLFRVSIANERVFDPVTLRLSSEGRSVRQGVEVFGGLTFDDRIRLDLHGVYNHARLSGAYANAHEDHPHSVFSSGTASLAAGAVDRRVPGAATWQGSAKITATPERSVTTWVKWHGVGPHVPIGEPEVRTRAYSVTELGGTWHVAERWSLDVELWNLFDVRYVELRSSGFVVPGAPRNLRAQLSVSFPRPPSIRP